MAGWRCGRTQNNQGVACSGTWCPTTWRPPLHLRALGESSWHMALPPQAATLLSLMVRAPSLTPFPLAARLFPKAKGMHALSKAFQVCSMNSDCVTIIREIPKLGVKLRALSILGRLWGDDVREGTRHPGKDLGDTRHCGATLTPTCVEVDSLPS